ncbi:hypothetical protein BS47DRAFT_308429 [Hydnum rufescens UP504]|uniref:Uncharacterized protein n=1 Tax=Hydnum rufescens UP504 TaxID=1448309 RepID=A0A9P6DM15_9AGAM|nr:hypothetical protein BS47DRAFT_308429 [Hydnum rufescens UP504]
MWFSQSTAVVVSPPTMLAVFGVFGMAGPLASMALSDSGDLPSDVTASLSRTQVDAIFSQVQRLGSYASKPDCFRDVASSLQLRCGKELEVDVDERVQAAVSMTLCEIATARRHAAPLECSPFVSPPNAAFNPSSRSERADSQASCVEALSRSAQFWSSYSGYLREIPQLCYAFGKWVEIDAAKTLYKNATMEKLALLRMLRDREISIIRHEEGFVGSVERLNETILSLRYLFFNLEEFLETFKQSVESSWSEVENMFGRWQEQGEQTLIVQHTRAAEVSLDLSD